VLEALGIHARFGERTVLSNVSLAVGGTPTAVVGPSGSGKSTCQKSLQGKLLPPADR
jgi:ABC-type transporter Mla maintaining outer membrane lipid asymmetry ATPase subunit MlaF